MTAERIRVRVLLVFGDIAELVTPWHGTDAPMRVPADAMALDARLPVNELPGRWFTAIGDHDGLRDFRLEDDPRQ